MRVKDMASMVLRNAILGIFVLCFIIFGLKGCIITVWSSPRVPTTYSEEIPDGRTMTMIFLPDNKTIIDYKNRAIGYEESVLARMRGSYGTHYLWRLWHIEGPGTWFGYRIYPAGARPVMMEIDIMEKYITGSSDPVFPQAGKTTYSTILFYDNEISFNRMRLMKKATDTGYLQSLLSQFKKTND